MCEVSELTSAVSIHRGRLRGTRRFFSNSKTMLRRRWCIVATIFSTATSFTGGLPSSGLPKMPGANGRSRHLLVSDTRSELERRQQLGYGSRRFPNHSPKQPHFGFFIATFEKADVRLTPEGLAVFAMEGCKNIDLGNPPNMPGHRNVLDALWNTVRNGETCAQNAQWGKATLEVVLAVLTSARELVSGARSSWNIKCTTDPPLQKLIPIISQEPLKSAKKS